MFIGKIFDYFPKPKPEFVDGSLGLRDNIVEGGSNLTLSFLLAWGAVGAPGIGPHPNNRREVRGVDMASRKGPRQVQRYVMAIRKAEKQIADRLPELMDGMIDLALGVRAEDGEKQQKYSKQPEYKALEFLISKVMPKSSERQVAKADEPVQVVINTHEPV